MKYSDIMIAELKNYVLHMNSYEATLKYADYLFNNNQLSASLTYYIKALENTDKVENEYHCLMMISYIHFKLGKRWKGALQYVRFAKALLPERPESYALYAHIIEDLLNYKGLTEQDDWSQVYEQTKIGLSYANKSDYPKSIYYGGKDELKIYYVYSLYKLNKLEEFKSELYKLKLDDPDNEFNANSITYMYGFLKLWDPTTNYHKDNDKLAKSFPLSNKIEKNYAQSMQDIFALMVHNSLNPGTYVELGAADPDYHSNTLLLEEFGWKGISFEINSFVANDFNLVRRNPCMVSNIFDYDLRVLFNKVFKDNKVIDYLSVDIEPTSDSFEVLYKIPFNEYTIKCITFEHNIYEEGDEYKNKAYELLTHLGYVRVAENVRFNKSYAYEDWYVINSISFPYLGSDKLGKDLFVK